MCIKKMIFKEFCIIKTPPRRVWHAAAFVSAAISILSFYAIDVPLARSMHSVSGHFHYLERYFGSGTLLITEVALCMVAIFARSLKNDISLISNVITVACATSICVYAINECILKCIFGVVNPSNVLNGGLHTIHWFAGSYYSSFPSGHMVLASSFVGVVSSVYRACIWPLSVLLIFAAFLLVAGNWHFLSDIISGTFLGVTAGAVIGRYWATKARYLLSADRQ